ncbi:hypothetical protein JQ596_16895 [Bradyrhizobium manausense]|uniref:hypothetical protein n=1 Tax=Bradyrhizobium TaxID=374 RepID=UPI001BACF681|nr:MULTISPECIES: hypothetical protein [Bradyrhizobium]MBR0827210.1 hypothetical protein [Bradyrhizobium manausense]UVO27060.1 hypothetical protein KUF59_31705 [Bradyrhizobium arachidis]UVO27108.1 hypothetical protein KUF59_31980 [Bradyrhizobium arachidis]
MNSPDQDVLYRAIVDARRILSEDRLGSLDLVQTLRRLQAVLDSDELVHALDRSNHHPVSRLER